MNILFISNGNYEYDGRTRELIKVAEIIGKTTSITCGNNAKDQNHHIFEKKGKLSYFAYILYCIKIAKTLPEINLLFVDNRKAIIPAFVIKWLKSPQYVIQDMRELYLINEVKHIAGKIGCYIEKLFLTRTDFIIVANLYRAQYVYQKFKVKREPIVYENIRRLSFGSDMNIQELEKKYGHIFCKNTVKIISTSGYSVTRTNDKLVYSMAELGIGYELYLVGNGDSKDYQIVNEIIQKNKLENVHFLGQLNENELKFVIKQCQIGIVNYHMDDMNNLYCASGKIYEFLFEGIPVVTTENPPLKDLCNKSGIGCSDNDYVSAIKEVSKNYDKYKAAVHSFISTIDDKENNEKLAKELLKEMAGE